MPQWHLYLIRTRDGSFYTGITTDVFRRFAEHQSGGCRCARCLRGRRPLRLVFKRRLGSRSLALRVEWRMRRLPKHKKEEIVRSAPSRRGLIARLGIQNGSGS
jgi:putative endonuclease